MQLEGCFWGIAVAEVDSDGFAYSHLLFLNLKIQSNHCFMRTIYDQLVDEIRYNHAITGQRIVFYAVIVSVSKPYQMHLYTLCRLKPANIKVFYIPYYIESF